MKTLTRVKPNVGIYDSLLVRTEKRKEREPMTETFGRTLRISMVVLFMAVCVIAGALVFTRSYFVLKILLGIGGISVLVSLGILVLKYSGVAEAVRISNPTTLPAGDIAAVFGIIGIFCFVVPITFAVVYIPDFIPQVQRFITDQTTTTKEMLNILRRLDPKPSG